MENQDLKDFKKMTKEKKMNLQLITAITVVILGCGLSIAGFIVAPLGQIHESVLLQFGEMVTFAGALFGVDYHYKAKLG